MNDTHSDALVFFGATGDLAFKKIFPALQAMIKRGTLTVPVIGVAKAGWGIEQLKERAHASLEQHGGGADPEAFAKLTSLLSYVDGDYADAATFRAGRRAAARPDAGEIRRPRVRFGRGTLDDQGGDRRGAAGTGAHHGALRALQLPG